MKRITVKTETKRFKTYWRKYIIQTKHESNEKEDTKVVKSFDYVITRVKKKFVPEECFIDIIIKKDTKKGTEFFRFKVSGNRLIRDPKSFKSQFTATFTHILEINLKHKGGKLK